jgi:hypothetical protein
MASPFPGMDPYLEKHWGDVHTSLITYIRDQLQGELPDELRARVEERVVLELGGRTRSIYPDVRIEEGKKKRRPREQGGVAVAMTRPIVIDLFDEPQTQRFVEVRDLGTGGRLVTVIEVLSPSNKKPSVAQDQNRLKQRELIEGGISLVEIDLLRAGGWVLTVPDWVATQYPSLYKVAVRRGWEPNQMDYYPISLQEPLPVIHVPLRPTDTDVPLDLQALIELCHRNGGYDDIDYSVDPEPPLPGTEARWAKRLFQPKPARPKRTTKKKGR